MHPTTHTQPHDDQSSSSDSPPASPRSHNVQDTPHAPVTSNPSIPKDWEDTQEVKSRINVELDRPGATLSGGPQFTEGLFIGEVAEAQITKFLNTTNRYSNGRWADIPASLMNEKDLYKPLMNICNDVFQHFKWQDRYTIITGSIRMDHNSEIGTNSQAEHSGNSKKLKSSPDLVIVGKGTRRLGPSHQNFSSPPNYGSCISMIEVKLKSNVNFKGHRNQIGVYVRSTNFTRCRMPIYIDYRQCFAQQAHRTHVYTILINQDEVQILHYDRAGVVYSDWINYHERPDKFVLWICGIALPNFAKIGFHPSIYWERSRRLLDFVDAETKKKVQLAISQPVFRRLTLVGRGTICWIAPMTVGSKSVLIKQYWRSVHRPGEETFLKHLKGLPGIVEILGYQHLEKISDFRLVQHPDFKDRMLVRIMMHAENNTIDKCTSQVEILETIRDAVQGHQNAWNNKVLHRDVNKDNILRGRLGAKEGYRGILSDFDMAIWINRTESLNGVDVRTGDRTFQSTSIILNPSRPHDYKDDLQSFFWVVVWLGVRYKKPNKLKPTLPDLLQVWSGENSRLSALERRYALEFFEEIVIPHIGEGFTPPFINLLRRLRDLIWAQCHETHKPYVSCSCPGSPTTVEELCPHADEDYSNFLSAVDEAIEALKMEEAEAIMEDERKRAATGMPNLRSHSSNAKTTPSGEPGRGMNDAAAAPACLRHPDKSLQPPGVQTNTASNSGDPATNPLPPRLLATRITTAVRAPDLPHTTQAARTVAKKDNCITRPRKRRRNEGDDAKQPGHRPRKTRRNASTAPVVPESPRLPDIRPDDAHLSLPATVSPGGHVFLARTTRSMNVAAYPFVGSGIDYDGPPLSSPTRGYSQEHQPFEFTFTSTAAVASAIQPARGSGTRATRTNTLPRPLSPISEADGEERVASVPPSSPERSSEDEDPA
ncbi:hypothetical protein AX16_000866 [Volvariella volvacea WC 439]|nr:hypothetical protein AX16_000866 [Volvariella volvacea WC 439]